MLISPNKVYTVHNVAKHFSAVSSLPLKQGTDFTEMDLYRDRSIYDILLLGVQFIIERQNCTLPLLNHLKITAGDTYAPSP